VYPLGPCVYSNLAVDLYGDDILPSPVDVEPLSNGFSKPGLVPADKIEDPGLATGASFCTNNVSCRVSERTFRVVIRLQTSDEPLLITASGLGQLGGFSLLRVRQIHLLNASPNIHIESYAYSREEEDADNSWAKGYLVHAYQSGNSHW
jgi:hypothetical protein